MARDGQPATPPAGSGTRGRVVSSGGGTPAPPRRPKARPTPSVPAAPAERGALEDDERPTVAPRARAAQPAPSPSAPGRLETPIAPPPADSDDHDDHPLAHEVERRAADAWRWLKNSWAVTRWVVLVLVVGIGAAALIAIALAALFTLAENST